MASAQDTTCAARSGEGPPRRLPYAELAGEICWSFFALRLDHRDVGRRADVADPFSVERPRSGVSPARNVLAAATVVAT